MASEIANDNQFYNLNEDDSSFGMRVLLVDHDKKALATVGATLRACNYEVTKANSAHGALEILRKKKDCFDLVICELHMPVMSGFELLLQIRKELQLPVIMISADDNMSVMAKSLQHGASYFLTKPVGEDDVKQLWQHAVIAKKERRANVSEDKDGEILSQQNNDENPINKRKADSPSREEQIQEVTTLNKKKRMAWTSALHDRFLDGIKEIGLLSASPKKILELMNVPGLTRAHVASHLQKYRMVVEKLSEKESVNSSFAAGSSPQILEDTTANSSQRFGKQPMTASQGRQPGIGMVPNMYAHEDQPSFPNLQQTFNTVNSVPQFQYYGKSSDAASGAQLLSPEQLQALNSTGNSVNDVSVGANMMYTWPDMYHAKPSSLDSANTSSRQHPVANPSSLAAGAMNAYFSKENTNLTYSQDEQNIGSVGIANLGWISNPPLGNNYSGVQELNAGTGLKDAGLTTGSFNGNYKLLNETENDGAKLFPMGSGTSDYMGEQGSMKNVDNIDEDELDGDQLVQYFLDLESNGFANSNEQLVQDMMMNLDENPGELPYIHGDPDHLLGSNESEELLFVQPQGTSSFMNTETSPMNREQNAEPVSNQSPLQVWDMELLREMLDPN